MFVFNKFGFKGCLQITHTRGTHKQDTAQQRAVVDV